MNELKMFEEPILPKLRVADVSNQGLFQVDTCDCQYPYIIANTGSPGVALCLKCLKPYNFKK